MKDLLDKVNEPAENGPKHRDKKVGLGNAFRSIGPIAKIGVILGVVCLVGIVVVGIITGIGLIKTDKENDNPTKESQTEASSGPIITGEQLLTDEPLSDTIEESPTVEGIQLGGGHVLSTISETSFEVTDEVVKQLLESPDEPESVVWERLENTEAPYGDCFMMINVFPGYVVLDVEGGEEESKQLLSMWLDALNIDDTTIIVTEEDWEIFFDQDGYQLNGGTILFSQIGEDFVIPPLTIESYEQWHEYVEWANIVEQRIYVNRGIIFKWWVPEVIIND